MDATPSLRIAAEVRAEIARQRRRNLDLARELHITPQSLSRRLSGEQPFSVNELVTVADWLAVPLDRFTSAAVA